MASKIITRDSVTFYTINVTASVTAETSTTATVTWKSYITFGSEGGWTQWGVRLVTSVNGTQVKSLAGACTSVGQTVCYATGTTTITKTTSAQTISFSATTSSETVNGYGGIGSSYTGTASGSLTIGATSSYIVSYDANGGSGAPSSQTKTSGTALTLSTTVPTRSGYTFMGWGTSANDTSVDYAKGASYGTGASMTLYAIWGRTVAITYNANGGSGAPSSQSTTVYDVATSNLHTFTLSTTEPTRTDYRFAGWTTTSTKTYASYHAGDELTTCNSVILYAVWHPTIYDSYDLWIPSDSDIQNLWFEIGDNTSIEDIHFRIS